MYWYLSLKSKRFAVRKKDHAGGRPHAEPPVVLGAVLSSSDYCKTAFELGEPHRCFVSAPLSQRSPKCGGCPSMPSKLDIANMARRFSLLVAAALAVQVAGAAQNRGPLYGRSQGPREIVPQAQAPPVAPVHKEHEAKEVPRGKEKFDAVPDMPPGPISDENCEKVGGMCTFTQVRPCHVAPNDVRLPAGPLHYFVKTRKSSPRAAFSCALFFKHFPLVDNILSALACHVAN